MTDETMPRRPEDDTNWGGPREGAGKPALPPEVRTKTLGLSVPGALKMRYDALSDEQRKAVRAALVEVLEMQVAAQEG